MIKETIHQKDIAITNIYAPNIGAPKYIRQLVLNLNREIGNNTIITEDYKIPMTPHSSTLAWKIPWTEEPGGLQSMG